MPLNVISIEDSPIWVQEVICEQAIHLVEMDTTCAQINDESYMTYSPNGEKHLVRRPTMRLY
jgi:hypothetical protein